MRQLKALNNILTEYDEPVEVLAQTPQYEKPVQALTCYRRIGAYERTPPETTSGN
ncbi:MAG: hypothetical protein P8163_16325 [Candidatus Thiodiazotropha sp.]